MSKQWCEYCQSWDAGHPTRQCPVSHDFYTETMTLHAEWLKSQQPPLDPNREEWPEWLRPTGDGYVQKATKKILGD